MSFFTALKRIAINSKIGGGSWLSQVDLEAPQGKSRFSSIDYTCHVLGISIQVATSMPQVGNIVLNLITGDRYQISAYYTNSFRIIIPLQNLLN